MCKTHHYPHTEAYWSLRLLSLTSTLWLAGACVLDCWRTCLINEHGMLQMKKSIADLDQLWHCWRKSILSCRRAQVWSPARLNHTSLRSGAVFQPSEGFNTTEEELAAWTLLWKYYLWVVWCSHLNLPSYICRHVCVLHLKASGVVPVACQRTLQSITVSAGGGSALPLDKHSALSCKYRSPIPRPHYALWLCV